MSKLSKPKPTRCEICGKEWAIVIIVRHGLAVAACAKCEKKHR